MSKRFGGSTSVECRCDADTTCRYCLQNMKPWIFTPTTIAEQVRIDGERIERERKERDA